jgi:phage gpG-like protein
MFSFRLEIAGKARMERGIARLAESIADYRQVWPAIEDEFHAHMADQFRSKGVESGAPWAPLSLAYAHWKEAHYPGRPILQRTGDLYRSLTDSNDPNAIRVAESKSLKLGSRIPYAIFHQTGARDGKLPARREIQLTEAFRQSVGHHVRAYLVRIARQSGFRSRGRAGGADGAGGSKGLGVA